MDTTILAMISIIAIIMLVYLIFRFLGYTIGNQRKVIRALLGLELCLILFLCIISGQWVGHIILLLLIVFIFSVWQ